MSGTLWGSVSFFLIGFFFCVSLNQHRETFCPQFPIISFLWLHKCPCSFVISMFFLAEWVFAVTSIAVWGESCRLFLYIILLFCHLCINNHKKGSNILVITAAHLQFTYVAWLLNMLHVSLCFKVWPLTQRWAAPPLQTGCFHLQTASKMSFSILGV